jgi:hypothetical protein
MNRAAKFCLCALYATAVATESTSGPVIRDERFGVMTHFAQGWDVRTVDAIARMGVGEVRDELYWKAIETKPNRYVFPQAYDRYMAALHRAGVAPLIVLSFENPLHDGGATPYTDEGLAAFGRYAVEVLRHYGQQIRAVEVWNEYNGSFVHGPATNDRANNYLRLLRATYTAIKRERPDVTVVGGATSGVPLPYWDKLLNGGALDWMDALSVHPYRYDDPPEGIDTEITQLRSLVRNHGAGKEKPIWVTEIGWAVRPTQADGESAISEEMQAHFAVRCYALLLASGAQRVFWYLFRDHQGFNMGLVHGSPKEEPRPAYVALATMVSELRGAQFESRDHTRSDIYSICFRRPDGERTRVIWSLQPHRVEVSGVTRAVDWQGNPVRMSDVLDLDETPIFVTGPLRGLPPPADTLVADSVRDFSAHQGEKGWVYGESAGLSGTFKPLPDFGGDDWRKSWGGELPYLSITAADQHPSTAKSTPVSAVRRWRSNVEGEVEIAGRFRCGTSGDGVHVRVAVEGDPRVDVELGGGKPIATAFDFTEYVRPGTVIDFATSPGPGTNIDGDATALAVTIRKPTP